MSLGLKPLLLPQLVEQRKQDEVQAQVQHVPKCSIDADPVQTSMYSVDDASLSDTTSPVTPTFSQRGGGHLRYSSSSTSSLDLLPVPSCTDPPVSPTQQTQVTSQGHSAPLTSRLLPDVEEEDSYERDEEVAGGAALTEPCDWADCMCHVHNAQLSPRGQLSFDYDRDILSDSEGVIPSRSVKRRRDRADSQLSDLTSRLGSKLTGLSQWKSTRRRSHTFAFLPVSDSNLDQRPALSRAPSSRSSSVSAPGRRVPTRVNEPLFTITPAVSFYGSSESVGLAEDLDQEHHEEEDGTTHTHLERERRNAATPLLPPLMIDRLPPSAQVNSAYQSPLQSPTIAPHPAAGNGLNSPQLYPSPSLSTKPSFSSFRPSQLGPCPLASTSNSDSISEAYPQPLHVPSHPSFLPLDLDQHDSWSDRLGHANFTIIPKPYYPDAADLDAIKAFCAARDQARINYTKHLARTGENYGSTSKTYAMTEAKWAEIELDWKLAYDKLTDRVSATGSSEERVALVNLRRMQDDAPAAIPRMLDAEGRFPDLGDEDIVGPMVRETVMIRDAGEDRQGTKFWKSIAEKVGLRK